MEKLLSSRSIKKEPEQSWEAPALGGLCCALVAIGVQVSVPPRNSYELPAAFGAVATLGALLGLLFCWLRLASRLGLCPSLYHSTILKPAVKDRTIRFQVASGAYLACFAGLFSCVTISVVSSLCQVEYTANAAPLLLILMTPGLSCLCAYIVCKEGLQFFQVMGVIMETAGLALAATSIGGLWNWSSLVLGGMGLTALTARSMLIKITQEVKFDQTSQTILELLISGLLSFGLGAYGYFYEGIDIDATGWNLAARLAEATAWTLAVCCMNTALYLGPAALVLGLICLSADLFIVHLSVELSSTLLSGVALTLIGAISYLCLDRILAHTAIGRTLSHPKKTPQRDSSASAVYIRLLDR